MGSTLNTTRHSTAFKSPTQSSSWYKISFWFGLVVFRLCQATNPGTAATKVNLLETGTFYYLDVQLVSETPFNKAAPANVIFLNSDGSQNFHLQCKTGSYQEQVSSRDNKIYAQNYFLSVIILTVSSKTRHTYKRRLVKHGTIQIITLWWNLKQKKFTEKLHS